MTRVRLDTRVMGHPLRGAAAVALAQQVGGVVHLDPDPQGRPSAFRVSQEAWRAAWPRRATHRLVLQDDAVPCPGFVEAARRAVESRPDAMVAFYVGSAHPGGWSYRRHAMSCERYAPLPLDHFIPTVALALPRQMAVGYTRWATRAFPADYPWDDEAFRQYRQAHDGVEAYATIPCLVQHSNSSPSIMGHHHHGKRQAACWIGDYPVGALEW